MAKYSEMTKEELKALLEKLKAEYREYKAMDLSLNMARGKPSVDQLNLSMGMMDILSSEDDLTCDDGTDCRNYGVLDGIHVRRHSWGNHSISTNTLIPGRRPSTFSVGKA